jgi:hypothetical protein
VSALFARKAPEQFAPEQTVLPCQFFDRRNRQTDPIRKLMFAVLEDAVRTCFRCADRRDRAGLAQLRDVIYWMEREDSRGLFSFGSVCETLELDAVSLRQKLYRLCNFGPDATRIGFSARRAGMVGRLVGDSGELQPTA